MTKKLLVCTNSRANPNNPSCAAKGSKELLAEIGKQMIKNNLQIEVESSPCMGYCNIGPNAKLIPNGQFFHQISSKDMTDIINISNTFSTSTK
jgi:(2Fe-2S) ferredoxin